MANLYQIYISPKKGILQSQVEEKMNLAVDWYRLHDSVWVVETTSDAAKWQTRLRPLVVPDGVLFICKLDTSDRQGWMPKKYWEWIKAKS